MKKKLGCSCLVVAVATGILSLSVFASDGTVNFTGEVVNNTCAVTNGGAGKTTQVSLDKINASSLADVGSTGGFKPFTISVTGCNKELAGLVKVGFESVGAGVEAAVGRIKNTNAGGAKNVELQLRNLDNTVIKIGDNSTVNGVTFAAGTAPKSADMTYYVGYYATGAATPGQVNGSVTYSIIYP